MATLYVSITEADNYFQNDLHFHTLWDALSDSDKTIYIVSAMRFLDENYKWAGKKFQYGQEYEFPRNFSEIWRSTNLDDIYFANQGRIPEAIKKATLRLIKDFYDSYNKYSGLHDMQNQKATGISDGVSNMNFNQDQTILNVKTNELAIFDLIFPFTYTGWSHKG